MCTSCGQRQPVAEVPAAAHPAPVPVAVPAAASNPLPAGLPAFSPAAFLYQEVAARADTVLHQPGPAVHLSWQVRLDTLHYLTHVTPPDPAQNFVGDTSRGYQGYYTLELHDSRGQRLGRHTFTKADFYPAVGPELAISSGVSLPQLLGYSAPMQALVFTLNFTAPDTDWSCDAVLLLDLQGRMRRLKEGYVVGGPAVEVGLAHDGRTLLTGTEILRAGGASLLLQRPNAELRGALLLNDSLAVTVYEFGHYHPEHMSEVHVNQDFSATQARLRQPNAFLLNTHTGQLISSFRYNGFFEELGFTIPWQRLPATHTGYFLDDKKGLYLVAENQPTRVSFRPFASLVKFKLPQRPSERVVTLHGHSKTYVLYIDTLASASIRYQYERTALD